MSYPHAKEWEYALHHGGESHGPELTAIVSGVPAGLEISEKQINSDLARRQSGYGRGGRRPSSATVAIVSGVRFGKTIGSPVTLVVRNRDWKNWTDRMAVFGNAPEDLRREVTPRPGTPTWWARCARTPTIAVTSSSARARARRRALPLRASRGSFSPSSALTSCRMLCRWAMPSCTRTTP